MRPDPLRNSVILSLAACALVAPRAWAVLDIEDHGPVLSAGAFALRVTNAGILGNAFVDQGLSYDPSFEIQPGSGCEALKHAELWVGALDEQGAPRVSGGPLLEWRPSLEPDDHVRFASHGTPGTVRGVDDDRDHKIDEEILNGRDDDGDGEIDEDVGLFSQEVAAADYRDDRLESRYVVSSGGETHVPLGLDVHQEVYAWSAPGYEGIAGLSFRITNRTQRTLQNVRIGLLADLDSRLRDDRAGHLNDRVIEVGYSRTVLEGLQRVDVEGKCSGPLQPPCPSFACTSVLSQTLPVVVDARDPHLPAVTIVPLDHTTDPLAVFAPTRPYARGPGRVSFQTSVFSAGRIPGEGGVPAYDRDRYDALAGRFPQANTSTPDDYSVLVSCGPFSSMRPGETLEFQVALVATLERDSLASLMANAAILQHGALVNAIPDSLPETFIDEWYNGISGRTGHEVCIDVPAGVSFVYDPHCAAKFGNDVPVVEIPTLYEHGRCVWTDADCDVCTGIAGNETRVRWLDPANLPIAPAVRVVPGDHSLRIEWDNRPEVYFNAGLTGGGVGWHFAGYRVYKLASWRNRQSLLPPRENWALWGTFGTRTVNGEQSLEAITDTTLDYERILYEQKLFPMGRYAVADTEVLNGFDYAYVVSTVLERDLNDGTSTVRQERSESPFTPVFPQLVRARAEAREAGQVWVVPNPFRASEVWQRPRVLGDPLTRHIDFMGLPRARSTIRIWTVAGDFVAKLDHDGSGGDGQAPWDLISRNGQEVESGIYMFTVDSSLGHQIGRFVVIR